MATTRFLNEAQARSQFDPVLVRLLKEGIEQSDVAADAIVESFGSLPGGSGMRAVNAWLAGADDVPRALTDLLEPIAAVPDWVDWARLERGVVAYWRGGALAGLTLNCASLAAGYQSSAAAKPLIFTGELIDRAYRRTQETARWMLAATSPGGMRRHGTGFAETLRVRIMHAAVRRRLLRSEQWQMEAWGVPINNTDVAYGIAGEFSTIPIRAMRDTGMHFRRDEREDIQHLWRYVGHVLGVPEPLLPATEARAKEMIDIKHVTDTPADDDSRALVRALIENGAPPELMLPRPLVRLATKAIPAVLYGFTRRWAGDEVADQLHIPDTPLKHLGAVIRPAIQLSEYARRAGLRDEVRLAARTRAGLNKMLAAGHAPATIGVDREATTVTA
ncbi:oxygenase MpaB family protein [[Mycobacterium] nativiensis]|uniref:Oxygenase MpaB family protein n=1 Tax=[Mycobacterium] nativiensis TaxID=2855503 RepID=A0ABU5XYV8_9MYCO|nr:oxygenase MpaB family protein [Mycolicibacter sp. MYC340]MEB3031880.1 oxygenase MpaB family protein [Mycolicibacter sp. MYC340]